MGFWDDFNEKKIWIAPETIEIVAQSKPAYPKMESGVCLVVGTAPCSDADVDAALLKYPQAKICAVNEASGLVPADHIATCHGEKIEQFIDAHERTWGIVGDDYPMPILHIRDRPEATTERDCHRWIVSVGSGSAPFAAAVMVSIGFDLVILCGCPMNGGDGYCLKTTHQSTPDDPRFGYLPQNHGMVVRWKEQLVKMKDQHPEIAAKIRSMSGHTKEVFGGIE
jgi:hypothetical protein